MVMVASAALTSDSVPTSPVQMTKEWPGHDNDPRTKTDYNYFVGHEWVLVSAFDDDGDDVVDRWTVEPTGQAIVERFAIKGRPVMETVGTTNLPYMLILERLQ